MIKTFETIIDKNGESFFKCVIDDNKVIEVAMWSFYEFALKTDSNLQMFSEKFNDWEGLTDELFQLHYDFESMLNKYVAQFSEKEIDEFSFGE